MATAIAEGTAGDQSVYSSGDGLPLNVSSEEAVIFAALQQDLKALHDIKDVAKKIDLKREHLIPKWEPVVTEYLESGAQHKFEPLTRLAIWCGDAGQIDKAITFADAAIAQNQPQLHGFNTCLDEFISEQIHQWAQKQLKAGHSAEPFLSQVIARVESKQWLVTEPIILGMLHKLVAEFAVVNKDLEGAEQAYLKCIAANPTKHGVKTNFNKVLHLLNKPPFEG